MRLAPGLVVKRVEYGEAAWPFLNSEPGDGARFGIHQKRGRTQKSLQPPSLCPASLAAGRTTQILSFHTPYVLGVSTLMYIVELKSLSVLPAQRTLYY